MNNDHLVVGIDGGGTKTRARLADSRGNTLAELVGGASNLQVTGPEKCAVMYCQMILDLCSEVSLSFLQIHSIAVGVAGAGRKSDSQELYLLLREKLQKKKFPKLSLTVVSDADIALEAAYGDKPGIILIAGTGSIVYGRNSKGELRRMGGWGPVLGDPGSGTDIGFKTLRKLADMFDGKTEKSELFTLTTTKFNIDSPEALISKVYNEKFKPSLLTRPVFEAAENGDENALDVLNKSAQGLVDMLKAYIDKHSGQTAVQVTLKGGMLESKTIYQEIVISKISENCPLAVLKRAERETIDGAVNLALRMAKNLQTSPQTNN